jgi:DNA-binding PadR family transcriptional regulator
MHGYEVIQALEAQSGGRWRPSAGSVYPTLQQLADEGLVTSEEIDGRRTYTLTDSGRAAAAANPIPEGGWGRRHGRGGENDMKSTSLQLVGAAMQVQRVGSPAAQKEAQTILVEARKRIYRLLAEDSESTDAVTGQPGSADVDASAGSQDLADQ